MRTYNPKTEVFIFQILFFLHGCTGILSTKSNTNDGRDWGSIKYYKGFYRTSRQSDFWYPGPPRDDFANCFPRSLGSNSNENVFNRPSSDPFRDQNGGRSFNQPGSNVFRSPGRFFNNQGRQFDRPQTVQRPLNHILNNFNPYDHMVDRPTTQRPEFTTVAVPGMGTTISPCEQACPTTMQFDPVCGDNGVTYTNMARFRCAIACGRNVRILRVGACPT